MRTQLPDVSNPSAKKVDMDPGLTDPTEATSLSLNRRAFVALSTVVPAFGSTIAGALAQGEGFGKPHPPIVPEDDPSIAVARPQVRYGSRTLDSYYASPKDAGRTTPGVVVVQAIWGIDSQLRDTVRRLAKAGYIAIAPDLYSGLDAPSGDGATDFAPYRAIATKLSDDVVDADLVAAAGLIRQGSGGAPQKIGIVGFCMGGGIVLRQTVDSARTFNAASVFYGKVRYGTTGDNGTITPIALAYADEIRVPVAGSWGARDTSIQADDVKALDARLTALEKPHDFFIYDEAGHAFFDDTRESYVAPAATDAWTRTLAWFKRHLT
jgi:carboxymethylenebutenolidase